MSRAFTVLWTMQERENWLRSNIRTFTSAFGNGYRSRGVEPGDCLYILSCGKGSVWLWGRMVVATIETPAQPNDANWARDAVRADGHASTPVHPERVMPPELVAAIRFAGGQAPAMRADGPDPQTFRGVRAIRPETQALFEQFLGNATGISPSQPEACESPHTTDAPEANDLDIMSMRALSVRQPWAELILRGTKTVEYRSTPTLIRERVLLYASRIPATPEAFASVHLKPGSLVRGAVVGSVEITGCRRNHDGYAWDLRSPQRLSVPMIPEGKPQPIWFYPFRQT